VWVTSHLFLSMCYPGGGIGRHAGLKILWAAMLVWVQLPSWVLLKAAILAAFVVFMPFRKPMYFSISFFVYNTTTQEYLFLNLQLIACQKDFTISVFSLMATVQNRTVSLFLA
jgi:hypothetical protein